MPRQILTTHATLSYIAGNTKYSTYNQRSGLHVNVSYDAMSCTEVAGTWLSYAPQLPSLLQSAALVYERHAL